MDLADSELPWSVGVAVRFKIDARQPRVAQNRHGWIVAGERDAPSVGRMNRRPGYQLAPHSSGFRLNRQRGNAEKE